LGQAASAGGRRRARQQAALGNHAGPKPGGSPKGL